MLEQLNVAIGFTVVMLLLSMLITVAVQALAAVLDLRGRNLVWGLTKLFHQLDPALQKRAKKDWNELHSSVGKKLAEAVSHHPLLSHSLSGRAKAIRSDELISVLQELSKNPGNLDEDVRCVLKTLIANAAPSPEVVSVASQLAAAVNVKVPSFSQEFQRVVDQTIGRAGRLEAGVERWFDTVMQRTSDVFVRWTKVFTIACALVIAFGFRVNSIQIYHQIENNQEVGAKLSGIADETAKKAADVLAISTTRVNKAWDEFQSANAENAQLKALPARPAFQRCSDVENWMAQQKLGDSLIGGFTQACQNQALEELKNVGTDFSAIRTTIDDTNLKLTSGTWKLSSPVNMKFWSDNFTSIRQFLGLLSTAFLLSLGAPFWYNVLQQLSTLKSPTAQKVAQEQQDITPNTRPAAARASAAGA